MLLSLSVRGYAIINEIDITFSDGLNILSGETGAGKSIIVGALSIVLGNRASLDSIRTGSDSMKVTALFSTNDDPRLSYILSQNDIEKPDDSLILSREVFRNGRNICKINSSIVPVSILKEVAGELVDIHGQHEHQKLLDNDNHISILDEYGKDDIAPLKEEVVLSYNAYSQKRKEYGSLIKLKKDYEANYDEIKRSYDEICEINPKIGEDEEVENRLRLLSNSEKLTEALENSYRDLYSSSDSIGVKLGEVIRHIEYASQFDKTMKDASKTLSDAAIMVEEAVFAIREYKASIDFDPSELEYLNERTVKLNRLKKLYAPTIEELIELKNSMEANLSKIENFDSEMAKKKAEYEKVKQEYIVCADKLSIKRKEVALRLSNLLVEELELLNMPGVSFKVDFSQKEGNSYYSHSGYDTVVFLISTNVGQEEKQLSKIASGGEISRIMLAIKAILAESDNVDTLIFDEIDTGISGRTAQVVAEELVKLSRAHQIISITHLPQIASMGDRHFLIKKSNDTNQTFTQFYELDCDGQKTELARMLGGVELTKTTLDHAEEMLMMADIFKNNL